MFDYDIQNSTPLCEIIESFGSDKGGKNLNSTWHNYTPIYYKIFSKIKNDKIKIFELGLGTNNVNIPSNMGVNGKPGASLYAWSEFFPNSEVYGADIDKDILFQTDRIKTFFCDQRDKVSIRKMWNTPDLIGQFDIIIDDGLHDFDANICFLENSIHKLAKGGYYIIEDIWNHQIPLFSLKLNQYKEMYPNMKIEILSIPSKVNFNDNNLLIFNKLY